MHVLSLRPLRAFWKKYPDAEGPLRAWYKAAIKADWKKFEDVKATYGAADRVRQFTIFDIGGNKWRLITAIHYVPKATGRVYVRSVFTHGEYDSWTDALKKKAKRKK